MVAKVISGKTIRGVLSYNENKVKEGTAACIRAEGFPVKADELGFNDKLQTFLDYQLLNSKVKTNAIHISLNFDKSDRLDKDMLEKIAETYLDKIGFGSQPYLVYQHFDAAHPHIHLVTTNVKVDGSRIDLHNIGRDRSETARREIEIDFKLVKAQGRKQDNEILKPADLTRAAYGKSETKRTISNIVNAVVRSYKFTSIHELNAVLKQYNIIADQGKEGTLIREKNGLRYSLLDKKGQAIGVPIKASSIYGSPTLKFLSGQFELNEMRRESHGQRLRTVIDAFEAKPGREFSDFVKHMVANDVYPVVRQNEDGRIYGLTFIDNTTKCVFNGSALGKSYSANGIQERFKIEPDKKDPTMPRLPVKEYNEKQTYSISDADPRLENLDLVRQLTEANVDHSNTPYDLKKKKKRKGRSI
ncbi:relaxase/mobilization nuclease domain-containing protein [Pseudochryseolinea flava]|uniref:Relaxase n=1 Tax=Pseudochryseolinea flava TaxID=2059302 RepID=A0A364Y750_9BACT|nr:relaxase/mobilization nuclease domain-containing protein [Pseudochryseolinea flava]RAW01964.1 relaxase [Pseudochryseolinea flava]